MTIPDNSIQARIRAILGVEAGEERATGLMTTLYFTLAASFVFVQTTAYGLFIQDFGARNLPFAYLSIALFASLLAYVYLKLSERIAFRTLAFIDLGFLAAACALFWLGLQTRLSHWFIFLLPFWFQTIINLANLVVWPLAGRIFDVRQAKRLFGLVGAGNWLANILLGGLLVAPLLALAGPANLYLFAAFAVAIAGLVLWVIFRSRLVPAESRGSPAQVHAGGVEKPAGSPFKKPYNRLIFAYVLLWWVSFYFIDNIFYDRAGAMFPDGAQLAAFIGRQLSVIGIIALLTATLLTGRIVRRFGLRTALLLMPLVVLFCTLVLAIAGMLRAPAPVLFWVAAVGKTLNVALGFSLSLAMGTLLYQPILGSERNRTQTIAEGIVQPVAIGVAGLLLLLFNTVLRFDAVGLSLVFLLIGGLWVWVILGLSNHYPRILSEALVRRSLGESTTLFFDPAGIAQLQAGLKNPHAGPALYSLNQLEGLQPRAWDTTLRAALPDLLAHPAAEVRSFVLQRLLSERLADAATLVRSRLGEEVDPRVYALDVQFLAALDEKSVGEITEALRSPERVVRQAALTGLLASGEPFKIGAGESRIAELVGASNSDDRLMAAEILADAACPGSKDYVARLLTDDLPAIRQAAVRAAAHQAEDGLLEQVVAACNIPATARVAEQALTSKGTAALPAILAALQTADRSSAPPGLANLIRVLGSVGGEAAVSALRSLMDYPNAELRLHVLDALSSCGYRMRSRSELLDRLKPDLEQAAWITAAIEALEHDARSRELAVLSEALTAAFHDARRRVMLLLSFGLDARSILRVANALDEAEATPSAFAVEAVDATLPSTWKPLILPLMESLSPAQRLNRWQSAGVRTHVPSVESLIEALVDPGSALRLSRWVTLCAVHLSGVLKVRTCRAALQTLSTAPDEMIAGLSCWSLAQMGLDIPGQGEAVMLSIVEKVLALKSASLFRQTPADVLADVAGRVEEVSFGAGETIFQKGDRGDSLYVIVSGKVQVWDGDRLLNELREGAIFGELALLDPAPRSATVKAVEAVHLLQLNETHFRLVLAERPEVATAVIHVLTSYIRSLLAGEKSVEPGSKDAEVFEA